MTQIPSDASAGRPAGAGSDSKQPSPRACRHDDPPGTDYAHLRVDRARAGSRHPERRSSDDPQKLFERS